MNMAAQTVLDFASTIGLLALLAVPYGIALDRVWRLQVRECLLGGLFGAAAAVAMLSPVVLAEGVFFDMRNLPVGLAGAFLGPLGALVAMLPAAAMRVWIGGDGVLPALTSIAIAGGAGMAWRMLVERVRLGGLVRLLLLGLMISLHLASLVTLPRPAMLSALELVAPVILALNVVGSLLIGSLITREHRNVRRRQRLDVEAVTDPLTGIANRRGFERRTRARPGRNGGFGNAVLLIDVDRFKAINDGLGHAAGDAILRQIGARLSASIRDEDVLARFGGEEFAVYLSNAGRDETGVVADRLRRAIAERPFRVNQRELAVTISVGVHWQTDPVAEWDPIYRSTDRALYLAKAQGRDRVVFDDVLSAAA